MDEQNHIHVIICFRNSDFEIVRLLPNQMEWVWMTDQRR